MLRNVCGNLLGSSMDIHRNERELFYGKIFLSPIGFQSCFNAVCYQILFSLPSGLGYNLNQVDSYIKQRLTRLHS